MLPRRRRALADVVRWRVKLVGPRLVDDGLMIRFDLDQTVHASPAVMCSYPMAAELSRNVISDLRRGRAWPPICIPSASVPMASLVAHNLLLCGGGASAVRGVVDKVWSASGQVGLAGSGAGRDSSFSGLNRALWTTRGSIPSMGSFLPHRPTMKARMLMTAEHTRAKRAMTASSMAGIPMLLLVCCGLRPRCPRPVWAGHVLILPVPGCDHVSD